MSKKISNLTPVNSLSATDLLYLSRPLSGTTYTSNSITYQNVLNTLDNTFGLKTDVDNILLSSVNWDSTFTTVQGNSAIWGGGIDLTQYTLLSTYQSTSGVYTTVQSNSATWQAGGDMSGLVPYTGATSSVNLGTHNLTANKATFEHIQFNINATPETNAEGLLQWNATDGTLDLGMLGGLVTQQVGQELFIKVINKSGSIITNGSPVYFNGRQGNRPKIYLAQSNSEATSRVMGIVTEDIGIDAEGFITIFGYVRQIKTNYSGSGNWGTTWAEGDKLYVSKTVAGQLTNVEPTCPHHSDVIGEVGVVGGAGVGSILILIDRHRTLAELSDVNGTPLSATGQFLTYNATTSCFDFDKNINDYTSLLTYQSTSGVYTTVQNASADWETAVQPNTNVSFNTISATGVNLTTTLVTSGAFTEDGLLPIIINGQTRYIQILM